MKIVLILGAGFSRALNLPVMSEFFRQLRRDNSFSESDREFIDELQGLANRGARMLPGGRDDLEHVLSYAVMAGLAPQMQDGQGDDASIRLKEILRRVYSKLHPQDSIGFLRRHLTTFLGIKEDRSFSNDLTVITTNYDLVAEFGFWAIGRPLRLPFNWSLATQDAPGKSIYAATESGPLLCKLHGSLNWYPTGDGGVQVVDRVVSVTGNRSESPNASSQLPYACTSKYTPPQQIGSPLIVPPTLYKQHTSSYLEASWRAAHSALKEADHLAVIGYSFPPSDTYMRYFLGSALADNNRIDAIQLIDPSADELAIRLRREYGSHFGEILRPSPSRWEQDSVALEL